MTLKVIGAGMPRTGTQSQQIALQQLLGGRCYHMSEVWKRRKAHVPLWREAAQGSNTAWHSIFSGYVAAVDSPTCLFWRELMQVYPKAIVLLSLRDTQSWWDSASSTVMKASRHMPVEMGRMMDSLPWPYQRNTSPDKIMQGFEKHNADVMAGVPPERLVVWRPEDGWGPLCKALGVPIPHTPFPKTNTRMSFRLGQAVLSLIPKVLRDA